MALALARDSMETAAAAGGGVVVDLDITLVGQIVLLLALLAILKPLLFEPMIKLFEEREKRIDGAKVQARRLDEASAGALTKYETEMQRARAAGNLEREKLRAEGNKEENEILGKVRESTTKMLEEGRSKLATEAGEVRRVLRTESLALGRQLAGRVLGHEVDS
jgi:F-type H+-transporting ATPase subunit b